MKEEKAAKEFFFLERLPTVCFEESNSNLIYKSKKTNLNLIEMTKKISMLILTLQTYRQVSRN
jgi:hypothetical protein